MTPFRRGYSLAGVLFVSVVLVACMVFVFIQLVDTGSERLPFPFERRLSGEYWVRELVHGLPTLALFVTVSAAAIWATLYFALKPVRRLSQRAGAIGPANLHERLSLDGAPTELHPLVTAFNRSLDRLETGWAVQRAFSSNAAHELRTPLAALRAHVESVLPATERVQATSEFDRLARLISQLLMLAESDADHLAHGEAFDLVPLARRITEDLAPSILAGGRDVGFMSAKDGVRLVGDPVLVDVAIRNLVENAMRHSPVGSAVAVEIDSTGVLSVSDNGLGIDPAFAGRMFDRFAKADSAGGGAGLGLSIVQGIMTLHGGRVWHEPGRPGAVFRLAFKTPEVDGA